MSHKKWFMLWSLLLVAVLLLSMVQPAMAQEDSPAPEPAGLRPDAPAYGVHGPYPVGAQDFRIEADGHTVDLTIWYPALNPDNASEVITYTIGAGVPDMAGLPISGRAIADAAPDTAHGPYPLVVFSPSLAGWRQANSYLLEHLASYGFVVIAADPRGETFTEFWEGASTRPVDTRDVIDHADTLTAAGGDMAGLIDTERIAVAGHSSGGWTALAGGGAQMDLGWCDANPDIVAENELSNCAQFVPHADDIAAILGIESTPSAMWPATNDPRVDAVVALAPDGDIWGANYEGVAALQVPTLVMAGTGDTVNVPERAAYPIYEHLGSAKKSLITFANGDHMIFFNQCRDTPWMVPDAFWNCADAVWDMNRAHDLINHFTTAFLLDTLKGDADAAAALAPENVAFPGITYEATGYDTAPVSELDAATITKIESIVQQAMADSPTPGFELCIVKDGQVAYSKGFGLADVAENRPATAQSVLIQASITKSLTAMAIMRLAEQGLVDLDAPVTDYLPDFTMADERYKEITVRMLLSHRSGLPDTPVYWSEPLDPALNPLEQAVGDLSEMELLFAPDTDWSYSGYGYSALGAIIAAVTGLPYEEYMQKEWLEPLGMSHSTFIPADVDPALKMTGYNSDEAGKAAPTPSNWDARDASTCMLHTNCEDMVKWAQVMLNNGELDGKQLLTPESIDAMWTSLSKTPWLDALGAWYGSPYAEYGLGWYLGEIQGHRLVGHAGSGDGVNTQIQFAPDDGLAVIAMNNWLDLETATSYPASFAATDVLYALLGIEPE